MKGVNNKYFYVAVPPIGVDRAMRDRD
jgi:hypothetical protein